MNPPHSFTIKSISTQPTAVTLKSSETESRDRDRDRNRKTQDHQKDVKTVGFAIGTHLRNSWSSTSRGVSNLWYMIEKAGT